MKSHHAQLGSYLAIVFLESPPSYGNLFLYCTMIRVNRVSYHQAFLSIHTTPTKTATIKIRVVAVTVPNDPSEAGF